MDKRWISAAALAAWVLLALACGGGGEALEERPEESPWTWGLLMSWAALAIGGGSAVLGIWIDRDRARPAVFAAAMSALISTAVCVGALQGYLDEEGAIETRAELERMLDMVEDIAASTGDPELAGLVEKQSGHRRPRPKGRARPEEAPPPEPEAPADAAEVPADAPPEAEAPAGDVAPPEEGEATPAPEPAPPEPAGKAGKGKAKAGGG